MNQISPISLTKLESPFKLDLAGQVQHMQPAAAPSGPNFKDALSNLVQNVNDTMSAPDAMMQASMTSGSVDVHDVMIANAKAELVVNVTAQVATKVMQAYDRILQIQI